MLFRIGINLGDVIAEGDDLYGDGVNIAARLQEQAAPGGIVISGTVYDQVRNKVAVGFDFLGQLQSRTSTKRSPSYALRLGGDTAEPAGAAARGSGSAPGPALPPAASPPRAVPLWSTRRMGILAVAGALVVAINLITWQGIFWARWPLLVLLLIAGLDWARQTRLVERNLAVALVVGVFSDGDQSQHLERLFLGGLALAGARRRRGAPPSEQAEGAVASLLAAGVGTVRDRAGCASQPPSALRVKRSRSCRRNGRSCQNSMACGTRRKPDQCAGRGISPSA